MRHSRTLLAAGLIAGLAHAQNTPMRDWVRNNYPQLRAVTVQDVLADAAQAGVAQTPQQQMELKRALQGLRGKERGALPLWRRPVQGITIGDSQVVATDNAVEHETNDGWQWADDMAGQVATGDCTATNDVDSWKFVAPEAGFYSFEVQAAGVFPIADSILYLRNHKGDPIAFDDNALGLLSRINIFLPAGTYYLDVSSYNGTGGGMYDLVAQRDPVTVHTLTAAAGGTTQIPASGLVHDVFEFTVGESRINLEVNSGGGDTALVIQRADGVTLFSNDDSFIGGFDAAADIDLPAGRYYAYAWDVRGLAGAPFQVNLLTTPIVIPDIVTAMTWTDSILGDESMRLVKVDLASPMHVDMQTDDGFPTPILDTNMALLDRDMDYILDVEDDDPFGVHGYYSRISMSLPAGQYYVAVTPYIGAYGDYTLSCVPGAYAPTGAGALGTMTAAIAGFGEINTYVVDNGTQASVQLTASDFYFGILGPDGELATNTLAGMITPQAGELLRGQSTIFTFDRFDYSTVMSLNVVPPLHFAADGVTVVTRAKDGDDSWLFANFTGLTSGYNFGAGDRGYLLLPQDALLLTIGDRRIFSAGSVDWFQVPAGLTGIDLQAADLHNGISWPLPALGTWRNALRF